MKIVEMSGKKYKVIAENVKLDITASINSIVDKPVVKTEEKKQ